MTIGEALRRAANKLKMSNIETPAFEAGVILCHVLNCDKTFIYSNSEDILDSRSAGVFSGLIDKRAERMPLQYITGKQEFMSLEFDVAPGILIPRQDTEILVEEVIQYSNSLNHNNRQIIILDIGTGSGCIGVSLAYYIQNSHVTALDISENALGIARKNAQKHNVSANMSFVLAHITTAIKEWTIPEFDIVVSNPPYIPAKDIEALQPEVKGFEPLTALDGGDDGLDFYRIIVNGSPACLKPGGLLAFEVGKGQSGDVSRLMERYYSDIRIVKDLSGIERVVMGRLRKQSL